MPVIKLLFLTIVLPGDFVVARRAFWRETEMAILVARTNLPVWDFQKLASLDSPPLPSPPLPPLPPLPSPPFLPLVTQRIHSPFQPKQSPSNLTRLIMINNLNNFPIFNRNSTQWWFPLNWCPASISIIVVCWLLHRPDHAAGETKAYINYYVTMLDYIYPPNKWPPAATRRRIRNCGLVD